MVLAAAALPVAELELRCPNCRLLVLTYDPPLVPVTIRSRCRRCHSTFEAVLREGGPTSNVRPAR